MKLNKLLLFIFWAAIILVSIYFYDDNVLAYFRGYRSERFGETFWENQVWFVAHMAGATCSLLLGPMQFWNSFRTKYMRWHRLSGKVYIIGSLIASIAAFRLSLIYDCVGCRYGSVFLSFLFFFTTALAWYAIKQKNIKTHKQFMIRSYCCALSFVLIRLPQILPLKFLFASIEDSVVRRTVREAFYSFILLFLAEVAMIWIPSLKKKRGLK
jgi:uncharacterized membrane protein